MITPSFGLTATERVLPKLALDFTTANLDSRITFTRTTGASNPATYVNSSGYVTDATNNQPRFDYDPITLICKGLLIEESRTNSLLYSNNFSNASWQLYSTGTGVNPTLTPNAGISPDGTNNAWRLQCNIGSSNTYSDISIIRQGGSGALAGLSNPHNTAISIWAKSNTGVNQTIYFRNETGAGGDSAIVTPTWKRISVSAAVGTTTDYFTIGARGILSDGVVDILIYGAQLELNTFPTSYIPTTTTALTRNADVATMTGTNFSDWFNASEGTFYCNVLPNNFGASTTFQSALSANDGTANNVIAIQGLGGATTRNNLYGRVSASNVQQVAIAMIAPVGSTEFKVAFGYKANNFATAANGTNLQTSAIGSLPTVDRLSIMSESPSARWINGWIKKISYWPQRLTNAEVQAFSKG